MFHQLLGLLERNRWGGGYDRLRSEEMIVVQAPEPLSADAPDTFYLAKRRR